MNLNWIQSVVFGFFSGLTEILPVSARAHSLLLLKIFGQSRSEDLSQLLIHLSILAALYYSSLTSIVRVARAVNLARIPKRKRKRPLDTKSLMDFKLWRTMLLPVILGYLIYNRVAVLEKKLLIVSILLFLNGVILYIPQFLPGCNKDSRNLSRVDGLLMGLGGAASVLPGISGIGTAVSIGSVRGVERSYALNLAVLMAMVMTAFLAVYDVMGIVSSGIGGISFGIIVKYILSSVAAFCGAFLGIRIMRVLAAEVGFVFFSYYCWGVALFAFILNLMA